MFQYKKSMSVTVSAILPCIGSSLRFSRTMHVLTELVKLYSQFLSANTGYRYNGFFLWPRNSQSGRRRGVRSAAEKRSTASCQIVEPIRPEHLWSSVIDCVHPKQTFWAQNLFTADTDFHIENLHFRLDLTFLKFITCTVQYRANMYLVTCVSSNCKGVTMPTNIFVV